MRLRTRSIPATVLAALLALAAGVLAPGVAAAGSGGGGTVRIGLEAPLSGDQSTIGKGMLNGAKLAAKQLNARQGIGGKQVEIVAIDDAADPPTGVTAANAAIAKGLDGVVGPYNSGVGAETLPLYISAGLVPIRLTSADATAGLGFTLQPMTSQIAPVAAQALTDWLKAQSVAIAYDPTALYTQSVSAALKQLLEQAGVTITAFEPIQPGAKSYTDEVQKLAATNPDVIYAATYFPEGGLIAKAVPRAREPTEVRRRLRVVRHRLHHDGRGQGGGIVPGRRRAIAERVRRLQALRGRVSQAVPQCTGHVEPLRVRLGQGARRRRGEGRRVRLGEADRRARPGQGVRGLDRVHHPHSRHREPGAGDGRAPRHDPEGDLPGRPQLGRGGRGGRLSEPAPRWAAGLLGRPGHRRASRM